MRIIMFIICSRMLFRYHWIIDFCGLTSRIRKTSFEEYMNWIAKEDFWNKIAQETIKSYFGSRCVVDY